MKGMWGSGGQPTGGGIGRPLPPEAIYGPVVLLALWLLREWLALAFLVFVFGWIAYCLGRYSWERSSAGKAHAAREAGVRQQLQDLRAQEFERTHGVPMPVGYGYYKQVTPQNDRRDLRYSR